MTKNRSPFKSRLVFFLFLGAAALAGGAGLFAPRGAAQSNAPVLISESDSTRAIALDSVARLREPFALNAPLPFGADRRTRIQVYAMNLPLSAGEDLSSFTAEAEDGARRVYQLKIEHVGPVPQQEWLTALTLRLPDGLGPVGDVLVRVSYRGAASNRVRVGIGSIGGGLADDPGSGPTPAIATAAPTPNTNPVTAGNLTTSDVQTVIAQAVSAAVALNRPVTVAVTDKEGNVLGAFRMTGAPQGTLISGGGQSGRGLEGAGVPSEAAAISKAGTASFFGTQGNAFTTRTAAFIIQEHFPPQVQFQGSGPLYGVQFSSLPCTDVKNPPLPLGLAGDSGSVPLYKNGVHSGGVGIEGDGLYSLDKDPRDFDKPVEELIAVAAGRGYEPPDLIRGDNILVNGIRLTYVNVTDAEAPRPAAIAFASLPGTVTRPIRAAQPSAYIPASVGGSIGTVDTRFFPTIGSPTTSANRLTAADAERILGQAARQADRTRAAIRHPISTPARVNITVVDVEGNILGIFRTFDAPVFGFDVSAQKARGAAFFSRRDAGAILRAAGLGSYVDRAASGGVMLDGAIDFSDRAIGFLHRPFYPDGLNPEPAGPFSTEISEWSPFNLGLQLDIIKTNFLAAAFTGANVRCAQFPNLPNGTQIFPGSVPLYKNGELVGAIGISGDGVDQDDIIAAAGSEGFEAPAGRRSDQVIFRGTRLPFVKFPRSPNL